MASFSEGSAAHRSRTKKRNNYLSQGLAHLRISECNTTIAEARSCLEGKISRSTSSSKVNSYTSLLCLLDELTQKTCLPFHVAFEEYAAKLEKSTSASNRNARVQFRDLLLQSNGLPVVIISAENDVYVLLLEKPIDNMALCKGIDFLLDENLPKSPVAGIEKHSLLLLSSLFPVLKKLLSSAIDLAVVYCILNLLLSRTTMKMLLGVNESFASSIHAETVKFAKEVEQREEEAGLKAEKNLQDLISRISKEIENDSEKLDRKRKRCDPDEISDVEFDIANKRQRLEKMKSTNAGKQKKQYKRRVFFKWKSGLRRQLGKNKGCTKIDRGAEKAVYNVLYEQLKAHERRWGDEGTGYIDEKRIQGRELRRIANDYLKAEGLPLVKSKETVRSWGKPRNKRSRQAFQHRGKGLWKSKRSEKKSSDVHVNVHYNRAHSKNYTRLIFKNCSPYRKFAIRRAMDDKAYLRCGTSEGFSRPIHTPVQISCESLQFKLPASDYPQDCGYVSPGVILLVNEMKEVSYKDTDKFVREDVTVTVTCKPKKVYPSSATNWFNDLYSIRYLFPEEHELECEDDRVPDDRVDDNDSGTCLTDCQDSREHDENKMSREVMTWLLVVRDSLFQFEMMNMEDDYMRCVEGGDHRDRELLRVNVLLDRLGKALHILESCSFKGLRLTELNAVVHSLETLKEIVRCCSTENLEEVSAAFSSTEHIVKECRVYLDSHDLPKHRPIDIQTSDAGPGVSSHEKLVQIRMAEYFQVFNLDLQARIHYAPNDSRTHIAEQVMRSLNEATGDGRSIPIPKVPIFEGLNQEQILSLTQDEFNAIELKRHEDIAKQCAEEVMKRYEGKKCLGTTIHSRCPSYATSDSFFFDEEFMKKVHNSSQTKQSSCAGSSYYLKQLHFVKDHYVVHDGAIEGIRNGCFDGEKMCSIHQTTLGCDWRGPPVKRVPAPVPSYEQQRPGFHYKNPDLWEDLQVQEQMRKIDEFCPRVKMEEVMTEVGPIEIKEREVCADDGSVTKSVYDANDTLNKMLANVDDLVETYTGEDLRNVVEAEFKRKYSLLLKAHFAKESRAASKAEELAKSVDDIDWEKVIEGGALDKMYVYQIDLYLEKVAGFQKKALQEKGFSKALKIRAIKKHYYSSHGTATQHLSQPNPSPPCTAATPAGLQSQPPPCSSTARKPATTQHLHQPPPAPPPLMVIPWGGQSMFLGNAVDLRNTCPIDNCLMIFHALTNESTKIRSYLENNNELVCQTLCRCLEFIKQREFAKAKLEWLNRCSPVQVGPNGIIDVWGNEENLFTQYLKPLMKSNVSSYCSSLLCPLPGVSVRWANTVALSLQNYSLPGLTLLESILHTWAVCTKQTRCSRRFPGFVPNGAPFYYGTTSVPDSGGGHILVHHAYCDGIRTLTNRQFPDGAPLILVVNVEFLATSGALASENDFPQQIRFLGKSYTLYGLTFYARQHYTCKINVRNKWMTYDGLKERQHPGSGLQQHEKAQGTPSHCFYVQL